MNHTYYTLNPQALSRKQRAINWACANANLVACSAAGCLGIMWATTFLVVICK